MLIKAKKSLGQNFLIDENILKKIVNIGKISSNTEVLEIGPGTGNLTEYILKKSNKKFIGRWKKLEKIIKEENKDINKLNAEDLNKYWNLAKKY